MKIAIITYITFIVLAMYGWFANLIDVVQAVTSGSPFTTLIVARIVGVPVFVLGAVLGWF
ncbi:hypothetical protein CK228_13735 [Mesorhizobium sp. WSM4312]|uniref:hypothetical protein n=1 Tax=Mesorhizobium sp. WSM4312 TaxID=2029411 RepID=UPI000BB068D3|nr:hypothetical protein [Mesorhizobium sp. WSM4312]PBB68165.1 hypothetical protein CK228_13735 [Mesorhizobium sp. WSM4312]